MVKRKLNPIDNAEFVELSLKSLKTNKNLWKIIENKEDIIER